MEEIEVSEMFPVSQKELYRAWLDSAKHSAFTGSKAKIEPKKGGRFKAWDGYIQGKTIKLEPYFKIIQTWRTTDFPDSSKDSRLEILFEKVKAGTKITFRHSKIPKGQGEEYKQGWLDYYFKPMKKYFKKKSIKTKDE